MVKAIPDNYPQVMPYLIVDGASEAIDFYRVVFGASERMRMDGLDGRVEDRFYGDRSGQFEDPYGHRWNVASHVEDLSEREMQRRAAEVGGS